MKSLRNSLLLIAITFVASLTFAQDGEGLFKAKCNVCHMLEKDGTGPNLKGVQAKWADAGEAELLYRWVQNSEALIASGESKMANEVKNYSPTAMTPQEVTNEEIDAILSYVDNYVPPVETNEPPVDGEVATVYVPNYEKNLTRFYFLILGIILQLIAILVLSGTTKTFVKLQNKKLKESNAKAAKTILAIVGVFGTIAATSNSYALQFVGPGVDPEAPWLLVEDGDLYILAFINIAMLFLVLHFRRLFLEIAAIVRPEYYQKRKLSKRKQRKMNKVLTDAVPIEEEHTILLHHEYDGIKELDNNLPPWWVWGFYATIGFAVIYLFNYHILKTGDLQITAYEKDVAAAQVEIDAYLEKMAMNVDESNVTLMTEASDIAAGKAIFEMKCAVCHGNEGQGNSCPNLGDDTWIYGYDIKDVFTTIKYGTPNGMQEHESILNPVQLQQVASFVISLEEVEGGLAPQGDIVEK